MQYRKKRIGILLPSLAAAVLSLVIALPVPAEPVRVSGRKGSVTLTYFDTVDGRDAVSGAEFTFMKIGEIVQETEGGKVGLRSVPLIGSGKLMTDFEDSIDAESISQTVLRAYDGRIPEGGSVYKGKTRSDGVLKISGMEQGVYLAEETSAAEGHLPSKPFVFRIPSVDEGENRLSSSWNYDVHADPKPVPCGKLIVSKEVKGNGGDKSRRFRFRVTFGTPVTCEYRKADGTKGSFESGSLITLSHGEQAEISLIPAGTEYKVEELEADKDGYRTDSTGSSGRIRRKTAAACAFINTKYSDITGSGSSGGGTGGTRTTGIVRTGDPSKPAFWILLAVLSCAVAVGCTGKKRLNQGGQRE